MLTSFTRPHAALVPQPCNRPPPTRTTTRDSWTLTGKPVSVSCVVTAPFSWVLLHTRFCLCIPRVCFPVLCKFWQLNSGVSGDLLQKGLCHTQVCCTQSPCPCSRPLLTSTSTGDTQAQFWLSLCEVSGFWGTQALFEPSEHLWWVWSLNLNMILPLLLSSWRFSFALGHGVSFLVRSNILFSVVVQQRVVILEFSQEKMGTLLLLHQDGRVEGHELTECISVSHSVMSDSL